MVVLFEFVVLVVREGAVACAACAFVLAVVLVTVLGFVDMAANNFYVASYTECPNNQSSAKQAHLLFELDVVN